MSKQIDHRQIADEMEIYFLDEKIGAGLPVWLPNGVAIRDELEAYVRRLEFESGYQRVVSPHIAKGSLYEVSGHLKSFSGSMFPPMVIEGADQKEQYFLRPMNCPHHHRVFAARPRSYRQLPLRLAEYGQVYRYENSGALRGLSRVRGLCQNDAHIYVSPAQAQGEIESVLKLFERCYRDLGLKGYRYRLSLGDPSRPQDFDGSLEGWRRSEGILRAALLACGLPFFEAVGEAAFYGPKIDVQMAVDSESEESIASVQLDFNSGEKFDLGFINSAGEREVPWVVHRAPLGSHERFVALLLYWFQGLLPGWLAPVQLMVFPVDDRHVPFAQRLVEDLRAAGLRAVCDHAGGSLAKRLRLGRKQRPWARLVWGDVEEAGGILKINLRDREVEASRAGLVEMPKALLGLED